MPNDFEMIYEQKKKMCLQSQSDRFVVTEKLFTYKNGKYAEYIKVN